MTIIDTPIGFMDVDPAVAAEGTYGVVAEAVISAPLWRGMARSGTLDRFVADLAAAGYDEADLSGAAAVAHERLLSQSGLSHAKTAASLRIDLGAAQPVAYQLPVVPLMASKDRSGGNPRYRVVGC